MVEPQIRSGLMNDIWGGFRPYFVKIATDFLIATSLWIVLFLFKTLTKYLEVGGWAADFIVNLHAAGSVAAFGIFAILFGLDLYSLHRHKLTKVEQHE